MRTKTEIVILNWNGAGHLRRFLPSVLASVPEGVGVVVADNGSTDDSLGVLEREFPAVGRIVLDRNYGFAGGYNRALEYLDADYFILLNSDVETPAGWVEPLVETLDRVPEGVGVVVADNGSTDDSLGVLEREFPAVGRIVLDRNYGFAGGYNRALEYLDADYFILLNSDVETPAGWVEPLVETLDRDRTVAAVAPKLLSLVEPARFEYAGASGGFIDYLGYPFCRGRILQCVERDEGQYDDARDVFWASGAAFCCRAEVFRALGGFDEDFFAHMEEIDLCWRMQLAGYRVRIEPRSRVYHLGGGSLAQGSPSKVFYNHRNNLAMLYKCASPVQRSVVAIVRPVLDSCAALSYLMQGRPDYVRAVGRAWRDFLRAHKALAAKRRAVRGAVKGKPRGIYCGSIVLRYLLGRRRFGKLL